MKDVVLFIPRAFNKHVIKPIYAFAIKPFYEFVLSKIQPAKYEAIKKEEKAAAEKAELDQKRANRQALKKLCLDVARKRLADDDKQAYVKVLAAHFGVAQLDVLGMIKAHEPRIEKITRELNKQMETGKLELNALRVNPETGKPELNLLRVDEETGKEIYDTRFLTPATEETRGVVIVAEKNDKGEVVERRLDADSAEVAKKLGNDQAMASDLNDYNAALEEYEQKLAAYKEEDAKYQKAKEKAEKKGKTFEKEAPVHPGKAPTRPEHKLTDKKVLEMVKQESSEYREELQVKVQTLPTVIERLKAEFAAAYPNYTTTNYILDAENPQERQAEVEAFVEASKTEFNEAEKALENAKEREDRTAENDIIAELKGLKVDIDFNQRHLTIFAKECERLLAQAELEGLETPDNLEIEPWKDLVYKDAKGNVLNIYTRDDSGRIIGAGVDKDQYAKVKDKFAAFRLQPLYNGSYTDGEDYDDQPGMEWSQRKQPIRKHVTFKDDEGKTVTNSDGTVYVEEVTDRTHWAVRDSNIVGLYKKPAVFGNQTPEPRGIPEVSVVSVPEAPIVVPEVTARTSWTDQEEEVRQSVREMNAEIEKPLYTLTSGNLHAWDMMEQAAAESRQVRRAASVAGSPSVADDDSEAGDDDNESVRNFKTA